MRRSLLLVFAAMIVLVGCPGPQKPAPRVSPPPQGLSLLYAVTGPDDPARLNRYDLRKGSSAVLTIDKSEVFGELVGRNDTRNDVRTIGVWIGSPQGHFVAHLTASQLRIAHAGDPLHLIRIATPSTNEDSLGGTDPVPNETHLLWSSDESRLYYLESRAAPPPPPNVETYGAPLETRLYEVRRDGSGRRLVKRFSSPKFLALVGVDSRRGILYWIQTGEGGFGSDLTAVTLADGRARVIDRLEPDLPTSWIKVAPAGDRAYFIGRGSRVVEIDLTNGDRRTLHQSTDPNRYIQWIQVSPDGRSVAFEEGIENGSSSVLLLRLATGRSRVLYAREGIQSAPTQWSPGGRYLVLQGEESCGTGVEDPKIRLLDVESGRVSRLRGIRVACPTEATDRGSPGLRFLAWLAA